MSGKPAPALRSLLWPCLFTVLVMAVLVGLGLWQLERMVWKEAILAQIGARVDAAAVPLPPEAEWAGYDATAHDYLHVSASGRFENDRETAVFRASGDGKASAAGPGYLILTPLLQADGTRILVNRGFVPLDKRDAASRKAGLLTGPVTVKGLLRPPEPRNMFTPVDDPKKEAWFSRDPALIAAHLQLARVAPFTLDADAEPPNPGGLPAGGATVLAIPNNHFSYALTWFGLALALAGVFAAFARGRLSGAAGRASQQG